MLVGGLATCAVAATDPGTPDPLFDENDEAPAPGFPDPLERVNRGIFALNREVDHWVFDPLTRAYRSVVPAPARRAVRRALLNLDAPVTIANDLLQLEPRDAAIAATRFVVNTTVGVVGLFDVAADYANLEGHESDFGQTLALSGVPSGPFLMIPLLGPTTLRDGTGYTVDFLFRPTSYLLTPGGAIFLEGLIQPSQTLIFTTLFEGGTELAEGITTRDAAHEGLEALEASSVDFYASLKNAYYQNRVAFVWRRGPDHGPLARARALRGLALGSPRREVGDLGPHGANQPVESLALEH